VCDPSIGRIAAGASFLAPPFRYDVANLTPSASPMSDYIPYCGSRAFSVRTAVFRVDFVESGRCGEKISN